MVEENYVGYTAWSWNTGPWEGMELLLGWNGELSESGSILSNNLKG